MQRNASWTRCKQDPVNICPPKSSTHLSKGQWDDLRPFLGSFAIVFECGFYVLHLPSKLYRGPLGGKGWVGGVGLWSHWNHDFRSQFISWYFMYSSLHKSDQDIKMNILSHVRCLRSTYANMLCSLHQSISLCLPITLSSCCAGKKQCPHLW